MLFLFKKSKEWKEIGRHASSNVWRKTSKLNKCSALKSENPKHNKQAKKKRKREREKNIFSNLLQRDRFVIHVMSSL